MSVGLTVVLFTASLPVVTFVSVTVVVRSTIMARLPSSKAGPMKTLSETLGRAAETTDAGAAATGVEAEPRIWAWAGRAASIERLRARA
ncbi:hypothetical protein D3C86_1578600 [compost metagenome]